VSGVSQEKKLKACKVRYAPITTILAFSVGKAHPTKMVWERFPTAIKIDPPQADSMFDAYSPPLEGWTFDVRRSLFLAIDQTGHSRPAALLTPET